MKRLAALVIASALVALILHPVTVAVNTGSVKSDFRADGGWPAPPFPPPKLFRADGGWPAPPFPPPKEALFA